jgi:hypothetical protein
VKKLKIYRGMDRSGSSVRDGPRRFANPAPSAAPAPAAGAAPSPGASPPDLPVTRDAPVKLSPDAAPPKSTPRP